MGDLMAISMTPLNGLTWKKIVPPGLKVQNYPEDWVVILWWKPLKVLMPWVDMMVIPGLKSSIWIALETRFKAANGKKCLRSWKLEDLFMCHCPFRSLMISAIEHQIEFTVCNSKIQHKIKSELPNQK